MKNLYRKLLITGGFGLAIMASAGCAPLGSLAIEAEYGESVRSIGLRPVYPPREDLFPGDVYYASIGASKDITDRVRVYVRSDAAYLDAAVAYLQSRPALGTTGTVAAALAAPNQQDLANGALYSRGGSINTLPSYAMPAITVDRASSFGLTRLLGSAGAFGLSGASRLNMSLDFHDVRVLRVPEVKAWELTERTLSQAPSDSAKRAIGLSLAKELEFLNARRSESLRYRGKLVETDMNKRCDKVVVVTGIYLTRRIDYVFNNAKITAAALQSANSDTPIAAGAAPNVLVNINTEGTVDDDTVTGITNALEASIAKEGKGTTLEFVGLDARGLRFARIFDRPVAVGWEGTELKQGLGIASQATPEETAAAKAYNAKQAQYCGGTFK